ncbi:MAG: DHH family phosphoesterase [Lachnospiraceae bacterium]|nr:DHH family phosphoesterase [Lachnospiraceae bacterium]
MPERRNVKRVKIKGQYQNYLRWPLALILLWAVLVLILFLSVSVQAGVLALVFLGLYSVIMILLYTRGGTSLLNEVVGFASGYGQIQKKLLSEFTCPFAVLDENGHFLWMNAAFTEMSGKDRSYHRHFADLFPEAEDDVFPRGDEITGCEIERNGRLYRAELRRVYVDDLFTEDIEITSAETEYLISVCFFDETERSRLLEERNANQAVFGLLTLDNYDEAMEGVEDVRKSLLLALVERKISKYFSDLGGIIRKQSHGKYFFIIKKKALEECEESRFPILDEVKTVNLGNDMQLTLSIGIGYGAASYLQNADSSRAAMELALGRGGDQAVVQDGLRTRFFGGKSEGAEKMTRVKARVKAHALQEIIDGKARLVVMGHRITDIDALGAAIGIYRAAKTVGKPTHIVADDVDVSLHQIIDGFRRDPAYEAEMFVDRDRAMELTGPDTALIVVDTNRAGYTACEELLSMTNTIVVLDHHRQGDDRIQNAVLSYIEPYASSACEMVAEILQYFHDDLHLRSMEADAMYAGIIVDTNNFVTRTGVRTFEAAAYLRRHGADITRVRKLFRDDMNECQARAKTIADAEVYQDIFAISACDSRGLRSPTVVAAQAANELLNVNGIRATFVMTDYHDQIYISARAIDEFNVQLIMERLGGGGHINIAGAQLTGLTLGEARELLKRTITEMKEEGDI